jgi:predicted RNase H-like HicB family nuclease
MDRTFPVVLVPQSEGGFFIECPSLPGCYSQGETKDEALENIREAILLTLEDLEELGEPVPVAATPVLSEVSVSR